VVELWDRTRRRPLGATGDHAKGRCYVGGLGATEDHAGREITLRVATTLVALGQRKTAPKVTDASEAPITEGAEQWTRVALSFARHANNYKC
jgi:hypothetical protein